jgi:hypothetical protein
MSLPGKDETGVINTRRRRSVYRFSRSIYRELAPRIEGEEPARSTARNHVLEASEATIDRIASEGRYFARPTRSLFNEIRDHFALADQVYVYIVVDRHISLAADFVEALPPDVRLNGEARHCPASTRKGTPCRREPRPGLEYCPSHRHLEETEEVLDERMSLSPG